MGRHTAPDDIPPAPHLRRLGPAYPATVPLPRLPFLSTTFPTPRTGRHAAPEDHR